MQVSNLEIPGCFSNGRLSLKQTLSVVRVQKYSQYGSSPASFFRPRDIRLILVHMNNIVIHAHLSSCQCTSFEHLLNVYYWLCGSSIKEAHIRSGRQPCVTACECMVHFSWSG